MMNTIIVDFDIDLKMKNSRRNDLESRLLFYKWTNVIFVELKKIEIKINMSNRRNINIFQI